jgi:glycine/D-amino acid oxidase-like deaminating enzyme
VERRSPRRFYPVVALDRTYDVAIVGAGLTGLRAAIDLARAGMKVVVFDAEDVGFGASRRNAGYLGRSLKKSYSVLRTHTTEVPLPAECTEN